MGGCRYLSKSEVDGHVHCAFKKGYGILDVHLDLQIRVPRSAVGVIIGKGGDMIKKIQEETGARVQFLPGECRICCQGIA